jgi:Fe-S cluster assembly iron-binding protein IscA
MLRITQQAASLLSQMRAGAGAPDSFGVRFFAQSASQGGTQVGLDFVAEPAEGDQVSKQEDMPVYVAADVAEPLSQAVVDAKASDGAPQLVIEPKGQSTGQPAS